MKILPLGTNILVEVIPPKEELKGLLWVPETLWKVFRKCKVIAVGPGKKMSDSVRIPLNISVGEYVMIGHFTGTIIYVDHKEYRFVKPIDIYAVITEE